jgi:hypothetical protein
MLSILIFSLFGNTLSVVILALTGILPFLITRTNPYQLGIYPNYIFVYLHHLVIPECVVFISFFMYFFKNQHLMDPFKRQIKSMIDFVQTLNIFEKL